MHPVCLKQNRHCVCESGYCIVMPSIPTQSGVGKEQYFWYCFLILLGNCGVQGSSPLPPAPAQCSTRATTTTPATCWSCTLSSRLFRMMLLPTSMCNEVESECGAYVLIYHGEHKLGNSTCSIFQVAKGLVFWRGGGKFHHLSFWLFASFHHEQNRDAAVGEYVSFQPVIRAPFSSEAPSLFLVPILSLLTFCKPVWCHPPFLPSATIFEQSAMLLLHLV